MLIIQKYGNILKVMIGDITEYANTMHNHVAMLNNDKIYVLIIDYLPFNDKRTLNSKK